MADSKIKLLSYVDGSGLIEREWMQFKRFVQDWDVPRIDNKPGWMHFWLADIDRIRLGKVRLSALSQAETRRSQELGPLQRVRFERARWLLRFLLKGYTGLMPEEITLENAPLGKPRIARNGSPHRIKFNLSHSANFVVLGFSEEYEVGVDIELVKPFVNLDSFARRFFSQDEARLLTKLRGPQKLDLFYMIWVRKEALLKAEGLGVTGLPLVNPEDIEREKTGPSVDYFRSEGRYKWRLLDLPFPSGLAGAACFGKRPSVL